MDEVALEEKSSKILGDPNCAPQPMETGDEMDRSSPELPWCVLCNQDARYRCLDCNDLYCAECNKQVHKTWGETDHRIVSFTKK